MARVLAVLIALEEIRMNINTSLEEIDAVTPIVGCLVA